MAEKQTDEQVAKTVLSGIVYPQSIEAEEALIGLVLADGAQINSAVMERLQPDDFFIVAHGWIFQAMLDVQAAGQEVDVVSVSDLLQQRGQLADLGGFYALSKLGQHSMGLHFNAAPLARLVRQKAEKRRILSYLSDTANQVFASDGTAYQDWNGAVERLLELRPFTSDDDLLLGEDAIDYYERSVEYDRHNPLWYPLPWKAFEDIAPVYKPGDIVVIAGPEGSGKSAMAFNMGQYYAEKMKARVLCVFTEMDMENVLARQAAGNSKLAYRRLLTPEVLTNNEVIELYRTGERMKEWARRIDYWECGATSAKELVAGMKRMVDRYGTQVIIIDGFNDLTFDIPRGQTKPDVVHNFMAYLETFARDNNVLVIGTVQLNRQGDALGSGAYKRKSALYLRIDVQETETEESITYDGTEYRAMPGQSSLYPKVIIEKNRRGPSGQSISLVFLGAAFRWIDMPGRAFDDKPGELILGGF
jgi:replicative DNA helicase